MSLAPGHHLLPHERWAATSSLKRQTQSTLPDQSTLRMKQNYGPVGMALYAAALITVIPGMFTLILGMTLFIFFGEGSLVTLGYRLSDLGFVIMLLGSIRLVQGSKAGRAFRGERPFVRP